MGMFSALDTSATGLTAQRFRMDVISDNLANVSTTRTQDGGPFRRKIAVFAPVNGDPVHQSPYLPDALHPTTGRGVRVIGIDEDQSKLRMVYEPHHPDRIREGRWAGYVAYPNVHVVQEMTDMISASRAYEANVSVIQASKQMFNRSLDITR
jgi:flagellar basal-body rod protein FlgC